jgi:predicted metal-dependent hydrolase
MTPTNISKPNTESQAKTTPAASKTILNNHQSLSVSPRIMTFPFSGIKNKYFFNGNSLKTCFLAGLSSTFPPGESEFIESVRNYREKITNPDLAKQVKGFIGQEGHHSHQHKKINQALKELGFDAPALEIKMGKIIEKRVKTLNSKTRLAITVCMEHLTAILAEFLLEKPEVFDGLEEPARQLMFWHSVEEIEHKAVAFDVYMECEGDRALLQKVMKFAIKIFFWRMFVFTLKLMWQDKKMPSWSEIKEFKQFLYGDIGLITQLRAPFRTFAEPEFHPWQVNSLPLIDKWENEIQLTEPSPA